MPEKTILVTTAAGNVGREIVRALSQKGWRVRAQVRSRSEASAVQDYAAEIVEADLDDPQALQRAFEGAPGAFLTTPAGPKIATWFDGLYEAAKRAGVAHVVKLSGMGVSLGSTSPMVQAHRVSDERLVASGLAYTILRPNSFYQNFFRSLGTIRAQGRFMLPVGDARQSLLDVRDLAAAAASLDGPEHLGQTYVLTGPEALTFHEIAERLSANVGRRIDYVPVTPEQAEAGMVTSGIEPQVAKVLAAIQAEFASGAYAEITPDLERLLGRPAIRFDQFARDHAAMFRQAA